MLKKSCSKTGLLLVLASLFASTASRAVAQEPLELEKATTQGTPTFGYPLAVSSPAVRFTSQEYACKNCIGNGDYHTGLDLRPTDYPYFESDYDDESFYQVQVRAVASGVVAAAFRIPDPSSPEFRRWCSTQPDLANRIMGSGCRDHGLGNAVILFHPSLGIYTLYAHMDSVDPAIAAGGTVNAGTKLGIMGHSGGGIRRNRCDRSNPKEDFCPHLHFEVKMRGVLGTTSHDGVDWGYVPSVPNRYGWVNPNAYLDLGVATGETAIDVPAGQTLTVLTMPGGSLRVTDLRGPAQFIAFAHYQDWYEIFLPSNLGPATGWVQATATSASVARVREDGISVRRSADGGSTALGVKLWTDQKLAIAGDAVSGPPGSCPSGSWVPLYMPVEASTQIGYVCADLLDTDMGPAPPTGVAAVPLSSSSIRLTWQDRSNDEKLFRIQRRTAAGTWAPLGTAAQNATEYVDVGLAVGATYIYRLRACNEQKCSAFSPEASATTQGPITRPSPPDRLTGTATSSSEVELSWRDRSTNEDEFRVERKLSQGSWVEAGKTAPNGTTLRSAGLTPNTDYVFRVRACNGAGCSAYSNEVQIHTPRGPAAPVPVISSVSPNPVPGSNGDQTLTLSGSGFVSGSSVALKNLTTGGTSSVPATYLDSGRLSIRANFGNAVSSWSVQVVPPTGPSSNVLTFQVQPTIVRPAISSVAPLEYPASSSNQTMTIYGTNFQNGATLTFDPPTSSNLTSNASRLTFVSSGQINYQFNNGKDAGLWTVTVVNPDGQSSNTVSFTVTAVVTAPPPSIGSVSPASYPASSSNQTMTVYGGNFQNGAVLVFDPPTGSNITSNAAKLTFVSSGQITYQFNNGNDAGEWMVTVQNPDGRYSNSVSFTVTPTVTTPPPSISGVSPGSYPASSSNQTMNIYGSNLQSGATLIFDPPTGPNLGSNAAKLTFVSSNQITYQFNNANDAGTWTVTVVNPDGQSSNTASFTVSSVVVTPPPSISSVSPGSYPASSSNQTMNIYGSGFQNGATLIFDPPTGPNLNSSSTKLTFVSSSQITYLFNNANDAGSWTVTVVNPDGQSSNTASFAVTSVVVTPPPSISSVSPGSYPASSSNQTMNIYGSNFQNGATLTFDPPTGSNLNSSSSKLTYVSSSQITYQFNNANDVGTWTVRVNNPDGQSSNAASFTVTSVVVTPPPSISSVSPGSYPASSLNQTMNIYGSGFQNGATLTFDPPTGSNLNSSASKLTYVSSGQITYQFNNANDVGTWTVRVNNPDGQSSSAFSFSVTSVVVTPPPSISSVSPGSYPASSSNQTMNIYGSNFQNGATLTFNPPTGSNLNSSSSKLTYVSSSQITYQFNNANDVGTWTVRVNNPDGQSSSSYSFNVTSTATPPSITSVSPSTYPPSSSNQTMNIYGSGFQNGATLTFDPPTGSNLNSNSAKLTFVSSSQITYLFNNANDVGTWTVRVNNPNGQSSSTYSFTVR
jgi:hypothetical protein